MECLGESRAESVLDDAERADSPVFCSLQF